MHHKQEMAELPPAFFITHVRNAATGHKVTYSPRQTASDSTHTKENNTEMSVNLVCVHYGETLVYAVKMPFSLL